MRDAPAHQHAQPFGATALEELEAEPALPRAGFRHYADDLAVTGACALERDVEGPHVVVAADEAREAAGARCVETGTDRAEPLELEDRDRLRDALHDERPEVL